MNSRRYIKRPWRVPKDKGPAAYLAALVVKALVKHGWPARASLWPDQNGFTVLYVEQDRRAGDDFWNAVEIAVRIVARTHRLDVTEHQGGVNFNRRYVVTSGGFFKETA